jgi:hypothetical protein
MKEILHGVTLASCLHDPEGKLSDIIKKYAKDLLKVYDGRCYISISEQTSPSVSKQLEEAHFIISHYRYGKHVGKNYKKALELSLAARTSHIQFIDFDRALHWVKRFPEELTTVVEKISSYEGFISLVRTRKAFDSHPLTQRTTETVINAIASEYAKMDVDIMSGAFAMERHVAQVIVNEVKRNDFGIYAEILDLVLKQKAPIHTLEVEGLEWETPDQFTDKIKKEGYIAWLDEFMSLPEWKKRVALMEHSAQVLLS